MEYNTLLNNLLFMPETIDESNIISYLHSTPLIIEEATCKLLTENKYYYFHFLDGDNWGKRDIWVNNKEYDKSTILSLFQIPKYKDCIVLYADEIIIIDHNNKGCEINKALSQLETSLTGVIRKFEGGTYKENIKIMSKIMKEKKKTKKGIIYYV